MADGETTDNCEIADDGDLTDGEMADDGDLTDGEMTDGETTDGDEATEGAFKPDDIVGNAGAPFGEDRVVLRGLLSKRQVRAEAGAFYRLFASTSLDRWLQIPEDALKGQFQSEGGSYVWVSRDAMLVECHQARACHFAEAGSAFDVDPTNSPAGKYPRY